MKSQEAGVFRLSKRGQEHDSAATYYLKLSIAAHAVYKPQYPTSRMIKFSQLITPQMRARVS